MGNIYKTRKRTWNRISLKIRSCKLNIFLHIMRRIHVFFIFMLHISCIFVSCIVIYIYIYIYLKIITYDWLYTLGDETFYSAYNIFISPCHVSQNISALFHNYSLINKQQYIPKNYFVQIKSQQMFPLCVSFRKPTDHWFYWTIMRQDACNDKFDGYPY